MLVVYWLLGDLGIVAGLKRNARTRARGTIGVGPVVHKPYITITATLQKNKPASEGIGSDEGTSRAIFENFRAFLKHYGKVTVSF